MPTTPPDPTTPTTTPPANPEPAEPPGTVRSPLGLLALSYSAHADHGATLLSWDGATAGHVGPLLQGETRAEPGEDDPGALEPGRWAPYGPWTLDNAETLRAAVDAGYDACDELREALTNPASWYDAEGCRDVAEALGPWAVILFEEYAAELRADREDPDDPDADPDGWADDFDLDEYADRLADEDPGALLDAIGDAVIDDFDADAAREYLLEQEWGEPMMSTAWSLPVRDGADVAGAVSAVGAVCVVEHAELGALLGLTGGGMDLSWDIGAGYLAAGLRPPVSLNYPRFAGDDETRPGSMHRALLLVHADTCRSMAAGLLRKAADCEQRAQGWSEPGGDTWTGAHDTALSRALVALGAAVTQSPDDGARWAASGLYVVTPVDRATRVEVWGPAGGALAHTRPTVAAVLAVLREAGVVGGGQ